MAVSQRDRYPRHRLRSLLILVVVLAAVAGLAYYLVSTYDADEAPLPESLSGPAA